MEIWKNFFEEKLADREQKNSLRTRIIHDPTKVDLYSNDYLNLGAKGKGSGGSPLISGYSEELYLLEKTISKFHGFSSSLVFSSGYSANVGLFSALGTRETLIIYDELIHASVRDGIRLSFATGLSFRHNDVQHLEQLLEKRRTEKVIVAVEALYSMDGDLSPLKEIFDLCKKYGAGLIVDEAHSVGVYGERGKGRVFELGIQDEILASVVTFGKALGSHGAAVLGNDLLIQFLVNFARSYIYSTAISPFHAKEITAQYDSLEKSEEERRLLVELSDLFDVLAEENQLDIVAQGSPIKAILISGNTAVKGKAEELEKCGFAVKAILSPTVPEGKERLRISLHSDNTREQIVDLIKRLKQ